MQAVIIAENSEEREFLGYILRHAGLTVLPSANVEQVLKSLLKNRVDLILLAAKGGTAVAEDISAIRAHSQAPLLLLNDPLPEDATCELLDAGADLVVERPFSARILTRYITIFLRRAGSVPVSLLTTVQTENISLDPGTRTVTLAGKAPQHLTPLEFHLLYLLMSNPEQVIPTGVIIERVWGYSGDGNRELVRGLVRRLRRKIEPDPHQPTIIHTHPSIGYRFSVQ